MVWLFWGLTDEMLNYIVKDELNFENPDRKL